MEKFMDVQEVAPVDFDEEGGANGHLGNLVHEMRRQPELEMWHQELLKEQQRLRESRNKYAQLYHAAPVGYITLNDKGVILEANQTFGLMLELGRETLAQKPLLAYIVDEDKIRFSQYVKNILETGKVESIELLMTKSDSSRFWARISLAFNNECAGSIILFNAVVVDITAQKIAENELRESEQRFRLTLDATSDGVWDRNLQNGTSYYGQNWARILGYSIEQIEQAKISWDDLLHPDDKEMALTAVQDHLAGNTTSYRAEFRLRCKDGTWKWVQARGKVVEWDANGAPLRFVGTHTDITKRKKLELTLRGSEELFRSLTALSPAGIFLMDPLGRCSYVNEFWCLMTGLSPEQAMGEGWINGIYPEDRERVIASWRQMIEGGGLFCTEYRLLAPDGEVVWVYTQAKAVIDKKGNVTGYIVVNTDISARKQAEALMQQHYTDLEQMVEKRTADLVATNRKLQEEIVERKLMSEALLRSEDDLKREKSNIEEANIALRVLLKKGEEDKQNLEEQMLMNVRQLVDPYLEKLKRNDLPVRLHECLQALEQNLNKITSPFMRNISSLTLKLSPMEIKVANFVKDGKTSKEIAECLGLSPETINIHRKNIRKKCGISNKRVNLRTTMMSLDA